MANAINLDNPSTLNMEKLYRSRPARRRWSPSSQQVYLPDVCAIGALYADWLPYGAGVKNYLAVPDLPLDTKGTQFDLPGGTIFDADLGTCKPITSFQDPYFRDNVTENIAHAWYEGDWTRHPWEGETSPHYTDFQDDGKYSWVKAPRFQGKPMQVGPLAQVLVGLRRRPRADQEVGDLRARHDRRRSPRPSSARPRCTRPSAATPPARSARAMHLRSRRQALGPARVENIGKGDTTIFNEPEFPKGEQRGFGFHEAPRGTLSHWVVIRDGKIANYQAVVPTTWNAGPRDEKDQKGPYEASLIGNPIADAERPLEVLRTVHSFDPCLACAVHTVDVEGREIARVKVL